MFTTFLWIGVLGLGACPSSGDTDPKPEVPEGRYSGMGLLDVDGTHFYMAGGGTSSGFVDDTWMYELDAQSWTRLGDMPLPLLRSAAVRHGDVLHLFGGTTSGRVETEGLLRWELGEDRWEEVFLSGGPSPRFKHMSVGLDSGLLVVGGKYDDEEVPRIHGDVWFLDIDAGIWTEVPTTGGPVGIYRHAMTVDQGQSKVWIHGGFDELETRSDWLWSLDLETWVWTRHDWEGEGPPERASHMALSTAYGLIVWGGNHSDESVWVFDPESAVWNEWALSPAPLARDAFVADLLPSGREILMIGGDPVTDSVPNFVSDVWKLNLDEPGWSEIIPIQQ